jgi:hypothetical protein
MRICVCFCPGFALEATGPHGAVSGKTITFKVGSAVICSAATNSAGTASCSGLGPGLSIVLSNGYTATFAGGGGLLPSSASAALIS